MDDSPSATDPKDQTHKPMRKRGSPMAAFMWMLSDQGLKAVGGAAMGIVIARHLGPEDYGRLGYAIGLASLGRSMVSLKVDRQVQRDLARSPERVGEIAGTLLALTTTVAAALILITSLVVHFFVVDPMSQRLAFLLAWMALPTAFVVSEFWFQSQGRMRQVTLVRNSVWAVFLLGRIACIATDRPVAWFAWLVLIEWTLTCGAAWLLFWRDHESPLRPSVNFALLRSWLVEGWPSTVCALLAVANDQVTQLFVQRLPSAAAVGHFLAPLRLAEMVWDVAGNLAVAVLPVIVARATISHGAMVKFLGEYASLSFIGSVGIALTSTVLSPILIPLILGPKYQEAVPCLILLVWIAPPVFLGAVRTQYMLMNQRLVAEIPVVAANTLVSLCLLPFLIDRYHEIGACLSLLIAAWSTALIVPLINPMTRDYARIQLSAIAQLLHPIQAGKDLLALLAKARKTEGKA